MDCQYDYSGLTIATKLFKPFGLQNQVCVPRCLHRLKDMLILQFLMGALILLLKAFKFVANFFSRFAYEPTIV